MIQQLIFLEEMLRRFSRVDIVIVPILFLACFFPFKLIPEMPPDLTARMWPSTHCRCQNHATQQSTAMRKPRVCALLVEFLLIQLDTWPQEVGYLKTVGGVRCPQCTAGALLSCDLFFSLQRLHLRGRGAWRPSFGRKKRKQMASRRRRGQRGVRLRFKAK